MLRTIEIEAEAAAEAMEGRVWYQVRDADLAIDFVRPLDLAVEAIADRPDRWPVHRRNARRYLLQRFPLGVVYVFDETRIRIIGVSNLRRRPGYWKARL